MPDREPPQREAAETTRRFLTFRSGQGLFALAAEGVAEVIRMPLVARLPFTPKGLVGLANLRGTVIPVVSLPSLLGQEDGAHGARAIVLDGGTPVALTVDKVEAIVEVDARRIDRAQAELSAAPGERLAGAFQIRDGRETVKILDMEALLAGALVPRPASRRMDHVPPDASRTTQPVADRRQHARLIAFEVGGQEYALALAQVREVIPLPLELAILPRSEALVLGVIGYRDRLLPLLSLRGLLGFAPAVAKGRERVVVTAVAGVLVGLVADRVHAIVSADPDRIEPIPPLLAARAGGETTIKEIYRGDGGRRLISIFSPDRLFKEEVMQRLTEAGGTIVRGAVAAQAEPEGWRQFLVFRLGDSEYGLPIHVVDEVANVPATVTRVPKTPRFLEGVINLRGQVLPIVDQRRRFDLPKLKDGQPRRLVVVRTHQHRAGLIVDGVTGILRSAAAAITPAPDLTGEGTKLVTEIVTPGDAGRIVMILDPGELLSRSERGLLEAFEARTKQAGS